MSQAPSPQAPKPPALVWSNPTRAAQFSQWLTGVAGQHSLQLDSLRLASADASFRRYFRIDAQDGSRIIMDAPPDKEDSAPFVKVAALMLAAGVHAARAVVGGAVSAPGLIAMWSAGGACPVCVGAS